MGAGALAIVATLLLALLLAAVVAGVVMRGDGLPEAGPLIGLGVACALVRVVLLVAQESLVQRASSRFRDRLRTVLGSRLRELGPAGLADERSGELAAAIGGGLDDLDTWITSYQPARVLAALVPVVVLLAVLALDPPTALVLVLTGPVLVLLLSVIGSRARAVTDRRHAELRWMSAFFLDVLRGIATLKAFGRSREQAENIAAISRRYGESTMEVLRTAFQTALVLEWAAAVATAVVAVEVSLRLMAGQLGFATALAVLIITPEFFLPLRQLAVRYHGGAAGRTAAERLLAILERAPATGAREAGPEPPEPPDPPEADEAPEADETSAVPAAGATIPGPTETRAIRFEDVWFEHLLGSPVLRGLDLELAPGRLVALVGPSGAGKSTLLSLLLRFADPSRGHIRVGDVDLADLDPDAWRSGLSWLPQRPHLGSGSIGEAIALARPEAGQSEVVAAASLAGADEFIDRLPAGYESPIGEGGIRLSGGQRQRVALARAFLRDGPVWLLDEPTAHVDIATEARILEAVRGRVPGRIVLVATHRRGLIEAADQVVLLGAGRALVEHPGPRFERMRPPGHAPVGSHAAPPGAQRP